MESKSEEQSIEECNNIEEHVRKMKLIPFFQMVDIEKYKTDLLLLQSNELIADKFLKRISYKAVDEITETLIKYDIDLEEAVAISLIAVEQYKHFKHTFRK